jgi:hypothetical protein
MFSRADENSQHGNDENGTATDELNEKIESQLFSPGLINVHTLHPTNIPQTCRWDPPAPSGSRNTVQSSFFNVFVLYERAASKAAGSTPKKSPTISKTSVLQTMVASSLRCWSIVNSRLPGWRIAATSWHV